MARVSGNSKVYPTNESIGCYTTVDCSMNYQINMVSVSHGICDARYTAGIFTGTINKRTVGVARLLCRIRRVHFSAIVTHSDCQENGLSIAP